MRIQFVTPSARTPRLLAEVELHFQKGEPLEGLKLVGAKLFRKPNTRDEVYVTLPARAFGSREEGDRGYFDYLRSAREEYSDTDPLRVEIIDADSLSGG